MKLPALICVNIVFLKIQIASEDGLHQKCSTGIEKMYHWFRNTDRGKNNKIILRTIFLGHATRPNYPFLPT